jgi:stage V sporulation protein AD
VGKQTIKLESKVKIVAGAAIVGQKEALGPLGGFFDVIMEDSEWGENSWEKTESKMQREAVFKAAEKAKIQIERADYIFGGDLLNQCISSSFGLREINVPFFGLYGACSTITEGLGLASMLIDGGFAETAIAVTSSHFCTAERQYRTPLEYGGQRTPTSQWTVTGSGALVLTSGENDDSAGPFVTHVTTGKIVDMGIKDPNNMGAAMAPAAASTLRAHFEDSGRGPDFYDLILTGDLGKLGSKILRDLMKDAGFSLGENYRDAGCMIFDPETQKDVFAGGSGCGCMASVLASYVLEKFRRNEIKTALVMATGALMSQTSSLQGESIPGIAHAASLSSK